MQVKSWLLVAAPRFRWGHRGRLLTAAVVAVLGVDPRMVRAGGA